MADGGGIGIGKPASMISTLQEEEEEEEMGPGYHDFSRARASAFDRLTPHMLNHPAHRA